MKSISRKSFTLIEVLLATAILSVIILSVYSAFNTGILAYKKIDSTFDSFQEARIILSKLESDLKNSFVYSEDSSFFNGEASKLDFFNVSQIYYKDKEYSNVCRIKYELDGVSLKRTLCSGFSALNESADIKPQEFSNNIKNLDFEYAYISEGEKKDILWQDAWPKEEGQINRLPVAVKIKLSLLDAKMKQKVLEFAKTIVLPQAGTGVSQEE